jgi:hypothetical protein
MRLAELPALRVWVHEAAIVIAIFGASAAVGVQYLAESRANPLGNLLWSTAMIACGQGFTAPGAVTPAFAAFARRERTSIACADVIGDAPLAGAGAFAATHQNLIYSVATMMRIGGVSWRTLDRAMGCLLGLSMALVYGLFRLGVGRVLAIAGVAVLVCSDHIATIVDLRDFSKELWFVAAWIMIGWLLRRRNDPPGAWHAPAGAAGLLVGVGIGFRMDLMVCVPVFPAVILLALNGWHTDALIPKLRAVALFLAAFIAAAAPTMSMLTAGSNSAHFGVLGQTRPFTVAMGLEPPAYDIGHLYADGFARTLIAVHAAAVQREPRLADVGSRAYDRQGFTLLADVGRNFPADQIIRVFAATIQVLRYPFTAAARAWYLADAATADQAVPRTLSSWRARVFAWIDGRAIAIAALVLLIISVRDRRVGITLTVLILYFCGYSMWQFGRRHTFHLDVIPIGLLLVGVRFAWLALQSAAARWRRDDASVWRVPFEPSRVGRALLALGTIAGVLATALLVARSWQQRHVATLLADTLDLRWETVEVTQEPLRMVDDGASWPAWYAAYWKHPERWAAAILLRVPPASRSISSEPLTPVRTEYFRVDVGGSACQPGGVSVVTKYTGPVSQPDWEFLREFDAAIDESGRKWVLLIPVFYWTGASRFDGFVVPADRVACVGPVRRASPDAAVPFPLLAAALAPDWRTTPLYQRLAE